MGEKSPLKGENTNGGGKRHEILKKAERYGQVAKPNAKQVTEIGKSRSELKKKKEVGDPRTARGLLNMKEVALKDKAH